MKKLLVVFAILIASAHGAPYVFSNKTGKVGFEIIKFKIGSKVPGKFNDFETSIDYDQKSNKLTKVNAKISVDSIDTEDAKRDGHLKSPDFFDSSKHPSITFVSSTPTTFKNGQTVKGKFTMKGVTKAVELKLSDVKKTKDGISFKAKTQINRLDYGITWNKALEKSAWTKVFGVLGKAVLDDKVDIIIQGNAVAK